MLRFDVECKDCVGDQQRFLAEFSWQPHEDIQALDCFNLWNKGLFWISPGVPRFLTIREDNTHGYYLSGARTFWVISCSRDEKEVKEFVEYLTQGFSGICNCYKCLKPSELPLVG